MKRKRTLTIAEAEAILLAKLGWAEDMPSKINPSLTHKQVFDILMGAIQEFKRDGYVNVPYDIISKNIQREFGKLEGSAVEILGILQTAQDSVVEEKGDG